MRSMNRIMARFKPGVPKRYLLVVTSMMWFFASLFLFYRGESILADNQVRWLWIILSIIAGLTMFFMVFIRISVRQIKRIRAMAILRPCVFSFFNLRGYIMMGAMITLGVVLRSTNFISSELLAYLYIAMAIPLLLSSVRFFLAWLKYDTLIDS